LFWRELDRQICVTGRVETLPDDESDAYFAGRPRDAQIGAWASPQSEVIADRRVLEEAVAAEVARFEGANIPRPPHWGGYLVVPDTIELWQGRAFRLHDRFRYSRADDELTGWRVERLAP
jgi:pyridoxamine 5'-phosphate oxidase